MLKNRTSIVDPEWTCQGATTGRSPEGNDGTGAGGDCRGPSAAGYSTPGPLVSWLCRFILCSRNNSKAGRGDARCQPLCNRFQSSWELGPLSAIVSPIHRPHHPPVLIEEVPARLVGQTTHRSMCGFERRLREMKTMLPCPVTGSDCRRCPAAYPSRRGSAECADLSLDPDGTRKPPSAR